MINIYEFSKKRLAWGLLSFSGFAFIACGLYFEHIMGLAPCHLCIVQRIAFLIIALFGLVAFLNPQNKYFRGFGFLSWAAGSGLGLYAAAKLVYLQDFKDKSNDLFSMSGCSISANDMMNNYPFLDWFPMLFEATGSCDESSWNFYGLATMEQLTLLIFVVYVAVFLWALFANLKNIKK